MPRRILPVVCLLLTLYQSAFSGERDPLKGEDTLRVLVRIKGMELVSEEWNHGEYLQHQFVAALKKDFKKRPVEFRFQQDTIRSIEKDIQFVIDLNIVELRVNEPVVGQQTTPVSRQVTTNNYSDEAEDLHKQHTTVYADLTMTEKSVTALVRILVSTTRMPEVITTWNDLLVESYKWENKSATYTGSFQALGSKDIELVRSKAKPVPTAGQVYKEMIREIFVKNSRKLVDNLH